MGDTVQAGAPCVKYGPALRPGRGVDLPTVFDHIGIPTINKQPEEMYVEATRVWVTDPPVHPHLIEFLRFAPNSPVGGPVHNMPHVAFQVDDLEREIEGAKILLGPFRPTATLRVVFIQKDGAVFEYMENASPELR